MICVECILYLPRMGFPLLGYPLKVTEWLWSAVTITRVSPVSTRSRTA